MISCLSIVCTTRFKCVIIYSDMMTNNFVAYSLKIFGEIAKDILFFPFWWYTTGLLISINRLVIFLSNKQKSLALFVWIKNIHRPMYGQTDWQGKLISLLIRLLQIIIRGLIMIFWLIIAVILFLAWVFLPVFVFYEIFFQIS